MRKKDKKKKKKGKRKKTVEKKIKQMKIYYVNIRGMKSKIESLTEIMEIQQPDIFGIVETHLGEEDRISVEGYQIIRKDRNKDGGGVLLGIKSKYKNAVVELEAKKVKNLESVWAILGHKTKYRVGVIYAPQGDKINNKDLKDIYENIGEEIKEGKEQDNKIVMMGDFNAKVGGMIPNGEIEMNRGGKELSSLVEKNELTIINALEERVGTWTRKEKGKRSIIDYVIMEQKDLDKVKQIWIDEEKEWTPYRVTEKGEVYTDHCAMICEVDWKIGERGEEKEENIQRMTKKSYSEYRRKINEQKISRIIQETEDLQEGYDKWEKRVMKIKKECEQRIKPKKHTSTIRQLMRIKRRIKKSASTHRETRIKMMNKHIQNEKEQKFANKIKKDS